MNTISVNDVKMENWDEETDRKLRFSLEAIYLYKGWSKFYGNLFLDYEFFFMKDKILMN